MHEAAAPANRYSVRAVERVADILDTLRSAGEDGASLVTLAQVTGLPKSSVFRYLATLEARGYVARDADGGSFALGLSLPSRAAQLDAIVARITPSLERLRDRLGETVSFGVLDGDRVLCAAVAESGRALRAAHRPGDHVALHASALGQAIAAGLPALELSAAIERAGLVRVTDRTITSRAELDRVLERVRVRGAAFDDGEEEAGVRSVAVPLLLAAPGALAVTAPADRLPDADVERLSATLVDESRLLARRFADPVATRSRVPLPGAGRVARASAG